MSQPSSFLVRHAALAFALKTFAAAMLAYSIAVWLDTPRPYWAMASVFITSNPLTGATSSKAVYRILGTLIGGAGTIVLIPNLVNAPELLSLGVALWYGIFLYFALIDGTPRSYVFMLAGYTVALLGFPVVSAPELTFDIVVSRVQEITLGIICASVVSMLVLPQSVASAIAAQADSWLAAARRLGADVLAGSSSEHERDKERMRLAAAASQIDELSLISAMRPPLRHMPCAACSFCANICCRCFHCSPRSRTRRPRSARMAACRRDSRDLRKGCALAR